MTRVARWWQVCALGIAVLTASAAAAQVEPADEAAPSPLLTEPKTPQEMFASAAILVDLARFDLARLYLDQFLQADPSDELLLALRDKHGTGEFLRLSRIKELNPTARTIFEKLTAASRNQAQDPAFVDALVGRLFGTSVDREIATLELRNAGPVVVPEMLKQLALRENDADRDTMVIAISRMGRQVIPVLIGGLESPVEAIRNGSIEALEMLDAKEALPFLWSPAFSPESDPGTQFTARKALARLKTGRADRVEQLSPSLAVEELRSRAWDLYTGQATLADPLAERGTETLTVWRWDAAAETVRPLEVRLEHAALELATRMSREAIALSPERADLQRMYLGTLLASEVQRLGWEQPPSEAPDGAWHAAVTAGEPMLLDVLRDALTWGRSDTAWLTLQALSHLASRDVLRNATGRPSPVLAALNYPDPRVQFAAAIVTLRAEPRTTFPSASRVLAILRRALTDPGRAHAIIIDPDQTRGSTLGGYVSEQGFDPRLAVTGREGFQMAAETTGVDLVVINANVIRWDLTQTVANFRADARTAFLPLVIYGPEEVRSKTARLIARSQPAAFAADSAAAAAFWYQVDPFLRRHRTPPISGQQRSEFKSLAAYWLATIANGSMAPLFDVATAEDELLPLVDDPDIATNVLAALSAIPTRKVQSRLAESATNARLADETRVLAAAQLAAHITRFGLVLPTEEVDAVTQAWRSAESVGLKSALAGVMGALKPNAGLIGERLRRVTIPSTSPAP